MNKGELITKMAGEAEISKVAAAKALDAFTDGILESLKEGDRVTIVGFGTYSICARAARNGRNPQTGEPLHIPAKKVVKFNPGKKVRDAVL